MEAVRTIVSADALSPIIDLPWASKNMQVEVLVFPIANRPAQQDDISVESLKGCLKEYANPALWEEEQYAWQNHVAEKYAIT
jgi:hypothetical protein